LVLAVPVALVELGLAKVMETGQLLCIRSDPHSLLML
jgi:hypothetical protein